jgi:hypothetical protein
MVADMSGSLQRFDRAGILPALLPSPGSAFTVSATAMAQALVNLLDDDAIALSGRMNAVGLVERGRVCHPVEKKCNQRQAILFC